MEAVEKRHRSVPSPANPVPDTILFGQYQGRSFRWLCENDMGYVISLLAKHQHERRTNKSESAYMLNKDDLGSYALRCPGVAQAVRDRQTRDGAQAVTQSSQSVCQVGLGSVMGFGKYRDKTYEDVLKGHETYVKWVLGESPKIGSPMDTFRKFAIQWKESQSQPQPAAQSSQGQSSKSEASLQVSQTARPSAVTPSPVSSTFRRLGPQSAAATSTMTPRAVASQPSVLPLRREMLRPRPVASQPPVPRQGLSQPAVLPSRLNTASPAAVESSSQSAEITLPTAWLLSQLPAEQWDWLGKAMFRNVAGRPKLVTDIRLWWYPPQPVLCLPQAPASPDAYFRRPFFLWMPYRMWAVRLRCVDSQCSGDRLTSAGLYRTVRRVLDVDGWYYMGTEYLECPQCGKKVAAWSGDILRQLDPGHRSLFPAILTYRYSCDYRVLRFLRERTLGNSVTQLRKHILEQHSEAYLKRCLHYLTDCEQFINRVVVRPSFAAPPVMTDVPQPKWLLAVYAKDVLQRLGEVKASVTSIFGTVIKMDSTKKVTKKLAGAAAGTAAWVTNVGNEHGQILMSVLTAAEGQGLKPMGKGLVRRYRDAGVEAPKLLYVDRDCCSTRTTALFPGWDDLVIRLDVWHFMRRIASTCTTESHPLYASFVAGLSHCIFKWDPSDVALLLRAKQAELSKEGRGDCDAARFVSRKELQLHCRRMTRGTEETTRLIQELIDTYDSSKGTDTMGVPLLDHERARQMWKDQQCHVSCLQDPAGFQLYMETGMQLKGGMVLPTYRCSRGSTSLESFHLHLQRFIPGTSASAAHFQAYLLEGLVRWNKDRAVAAVAGETSSLRTYSGWLQSSVNRASEAVLGRSLCPGFHTPGQYTGELLGIEYLFAQTGKQMEEICLDPDVPDGLEKTEVDPDEGFEDLDVSEEDPTISTIANASVAYPLVSAGQTPPGVGAEASAGQTAEAPSSPGAQTVEATCDDTGDDGTRSPSPESSTSSAAEECHGPDGAAGYQHVQTLAKALVSLRTLTCLPDSKVEELVKLWERLPDSDKERLSYSARHQKKLSKGRFKATKSSSIAGVESVKRCMVGENAGPAQWPNASRLVEAICLQLCADHPTATKTAAGVTTQRWSVIMKEYSHIRQLVLSNVLLMSQTSLQLYDINTRTLTQWYNKRQKAQERQILLQGVSQPSASTVSDVPAPEPRAKPESIAPAIHPAPLVFPCPPNTAGQARNIRCMPAPPVVLVTQQQMGRGYIPPVAAQVPAASVTSSTKSARWYRKKKATEEDQGQQKRKYSRKAGSNTCSICGKPKLKEFGHSRFGRETFCESSSSLSVQQWLAQKRAEAAAKKDPPQN
ncbi:PREDICTED: uncharacterized protein LOC109471641 [Branchiostoma belcheri]|uniref:Uncharacterized protein LOC109471641 n=1 Tax=Branchiostoma belcheri TaxID=7741 RepID=A0A6P4YQ62_BRABE|nr:PREDICTED: uncharacterized protein LOC109471641 [Branchiostoma belcheri]